MRTKRALMVAAVCVLAAIATAYAAVRATAPAPAAEAAPPPQVVAAQRFVLVDSQNRARATLSLEGESELPMLRFNNAQGQARAVLALMPDGGVALYMTDDAGKGAASLAAGAEGLCSLVLRGAAGPEAGKTPQVVLDTGGPKGAPGLAVSASSEGRRVRLLASPEGDTAVQVFGDEGQVRAALGVEADGGSSLTLSGKAAKGKANLAVDARDNPSFTLADKAGKVIVRAPRR
jgi:hypothetical protein